MTTIRLQKKLFKTLFCYGVRVTCRVKQRDSKHTYTIEYSQELESGLRWEMGVRTEYLLCQWSLSLIPQLSVPPPVGHIRPDGVSPLLPEHLLDQLRASHVYHHQRAVL